MYLDHYNMHASNVVVFISNPNQEWNVDYVKLRVFIN